ncbi:DUF455 family protein [Candidatus Poribacteria bacterium]|nr:DUF455 family protein [Candidatus Poribacteria bacterium]
MRIDRIRDRRRFRPGYDVDQNSTRHSNYYHVLREVVHLHNGWMPRVGPYDVKCLLGIHTYEDAVFVSALKRRLKELRHPSEYHAAPGEPLAAVLDFLNSLGTWEEYICAIYAVIKPRLIDAWEYHFNTSDPVLDEPSLRIIADFLRITSEHIKGGMALVETLLMDPPRRESAARAIASAEELWHAMGTDAGGSPVRLRAKRELVPMPKLVDPARDTFIRVTAEGDTTLNENIFVNGPENYVPTQTEELKHYFHALMDAELTAAEICALDSHENPMMPWQFHEDMARQNWDEIRHGQVMEKVLLELGANWGDYPVTFRFFHKIYKNDLVGRLILFNRQSEGNAMWRHNRRRKVMIDNGQAKFAQVFDYLLADEVQHVANGVTWATHLLGSREAFLAKVDEMTASAGKAVDGARSASGARGFEKADAESEAIVAQALGDAGHD